MKRVLVIGASGTVGRQTIRYLLSEGKYEVTALDIRAKSSYKKLKKYKKRIRILYNDICDDSILDFLVKDNDVIIYLAGTLPVLANIGEDMMKNNEYIGLKKIVDSIKKYNPQCYLIYTSSTSVYGDTKEEISTQMKTSYDINDYYSKYKIKSEKYIIKNLKNYTIYRLSYVLGDLEIDNIIYNIKLNTYMETISSENAGYALTVSIDNKKTLNRKIINLSGGEKYRITYKEYLLKILECYGLSWKIFKTLLFHEKNYHCGIYKEDKINDILEYRNKSINVYLNSLKEYKGDIKRLIPRILALPFRFIINMKGR